MAVKQIPLGFGPEHGETIDTNMDAMTAAAYSENEFLEVAKSLRLNRKGQAKNIRRVLISP